MVAVMIRFRFPASVLLFSLLFAVLLPASTVKMWEEEVVLPTYLVGDPDPNPMFYFGRAYQGAQGRIYPYPLYDKLTGRRVEKSYKLVYLENEYLKISVMPEIGGRIFTAVDKTNGYDFFYRQNVIKPALIGMLGAWISGGVEWNFPHHHRASAWLPSQYKLEENPDGSKTVWVGELELRHRFRWAIGMTLRPGKSYLETTVRLLNRTSFQHSFLFWANVAVHTNEDYQIIFPPSTQWVTQHAKNEFARWPVADSVYSGIDFTAGVDVSQWRNHPRPISMFAWNYEDDFLAGYDHGKRAGTLHVADHNVVPGKKFWTWGTGPTGKMWDEILSDEDGPYVELMVGAYSDNQPDYSWVQPFEVKSFQLFWYPFREIGGVKNATLDAAVNLEMVEGARVRLGFCATSPHPEATVILQAREKVLLKERIAIAPDKAYVKEVALPAGVREEDLRASLSAGGRQLVAYTPVKRAPEPMPEPVKPPPPPDRIETVEELYLTGQRLDQFHSPAFEPYPYYEEALRRDPGDSRVNTALGILYAKRGMYEKAEEHLRRGIARLTHRHTIPRIGEPYYYLGLVLKEQGKLDEAYKEFYKATWSAAWQAAGYFSLAEIAGHRGDWTAALDFADRSLKVNAWNTRALKLKSAVLRRMGRPEEAAQVAASAVRIDPLDVRAGARDFPEAGLEMAVEYANAGLWDEAMKVLGEMAAASSDPSKVSPMVYYYLGWFAEQSGQKTRATEHFRTAAKLPADYAFPFQLEAIRPLRRAMELNPRDGRAPYYLGNLLFDLQPDNAVRLWEEARMRDPAFSTVYRNLALAYARQQDNLEKAITSLEKAVALNGNDPMHLFELDQLYEASGVSPQKRLAMLDQHHATVLKRDDTLSRQIALRVNAGEYDRAIELLSDRQFNLWEGGARFGVSESWTDAHLLRGHKRRLAGDHSGALADYRLALEFPEGLQAAGTRRGGRFPEVSFWIGTVYEAMGDAARARQAWKESAAGGSRSEGPMSYYRARSLDKLGERDKAAAIFHSLIESGEAALKAGETVDYFAKFGERQSHNDQMAQAHYLAALGNLGLNRPVEAKRHLERALALKPDHLGAKVAQAF